MEVPAVRTCVGCRRKAPKEELVRIVRGLDGAIAVDRSGRTPGRGAYVCSSKGCLEAALGRGKLGRALRAGLGAADNERLRREFGG